MERQGERSQLRTRCLARIGAVLLLALGTSVAQSAGFDSTRSGVEPTLVRSIQGNTQIAEIKGADSTVQTIASPEYRVDTGDRVSVLVYQEPDLSVTGIRVKANGTIAYPLLGNLAVSGLTSQQVHDLVKKRLLDGYLKKPHLTVSIDSYRLYFIKGEVKRPGGYSFVDGLTVAKAVALAGGYTVRASQKSISLVRESDPENALESVGSNTAIRPGDIITVGESFF